MDKQTLLARLDELDERKRALQRKRQQLHDNECSCVLLDRLISKTHKAKNQVANQLRNLDDDQEAESSPLPRDCDIIA